MTGVKLIDNKIKKLDKIVECDKRSQKKKNGIHDKKSFIMRDNFFVKFFIQK